LTSRYRPWGARIRFSGREERCVLRRALRDGGARWGGFRRDGATPIGELLTKHTRWSAPYGVAGCIGDAARMGGGHVAQYLAD
jgi:hypothetical protein